MLPMPFLGYIVHTGPYKGGVDKLKNVSGLQVQRMQEEAPVIQFIVYLVAAGFAAHCSSTLHKEAKVINIIINILVHSVCKVRRQSGIKA
eukprot:4849269-Ditylum_brightwellii.AAC.2